MDSRRMTRLVLGTMAFFAFSFASASHAEMTPSVPNASTSAYGKNYHIREGGHYPNGNSYPMYSSSTVTRTVRFDETAIYTTKSASNQADINKLFGFSDCRSHHDTNSARVGWRYYKGAIELHAYTYKAGVRSSVKIGTIRPYETRKLKIAKAGTQYIFYDEGVEVARMPRGCGGNPFGSYLLTPYFGGDEVAPHDIDIKLER